MNLSRQYRFSPLWLTCTIYMVSNGYFLTHTRKPFTSVKNKILNPSYSEENKSKGVSHLSKNGYQSCHFKTNFMVEVWWKGRHKEETDLDEDRLHLWETKKKIKCWFIFQHLKTGTVQRRKGKKITSLMTYYTSQ